MKKTLVEISRLTCTCLLALLYGIAYAQNAEAPGLTVQSEGHHWLHGMAFGGNDRWVAVATFDGRVRIYDVESGRLARTLSPHAEPSRQMPGTVFATSPVADLIALPIGQQDVAIVDINTEKEVIRLSTLRSPSDPSLTLRAIRFSRDGKSITANYSVTRRRTFLGFETLFTTIMWQVESGHQVSSETSSYNDMPAVYSAHPRAVTASGDRFAVIRGDILDVCETAHPENCRRSTVSPSQTDMPGDKTEASINVPAAAVLTEDSRWLIVRARNGELDVWDTVTGDRAPFRIPASNDSSSPIYTRSVSGHGTSGLGFDVLAHLSFMGSVSPKPTICVSTDGRFAVETSPDDPDSSTAYLIETNTRRVVSSLNFGVDFKAGCSISPGGTRLLVAGVESGARRPKGSPSGRFRLGFGGRKTRLTVVDVQSGATISYLKHGRGEKPAECPFPASFAHWSADGTYVVGGGERLQNRHSDDHGPIRVWRADSGVEEVLPDMANSAAVIGALPGGAHFAVTRRRREPGAIGWYQAFGEYGLEVWDVSSGHKMFSIAEASVGVQSLRASPNGTVLFGHDRDNALTFWHRGTGKLLGRLFLQSRGDWLVTTPTGLFDGSRSGWSRINWRTNERRVEVVPGELFFNEYYRPGLLASLLNGESPAAKIELSMVDRRQPAVKLYITATAQRLLTVTIDVREAPADSQYTSSSGMRDLRLFRNGKLLKAWRGVLTPSKDGVASFVTAVPLVAGMNRISAYAFNRHNVRSSEAVQNFNSDGTGDPRRTYVVAIGVSRYSNAEYNLQYAAADATIFGKQFGDAQIALAGDSGHVDVVTLLDGDATRKNIVTALELLGGTRAQPLPPDAPPALARLAKAQPNDTVVVYFAGHGIAAHGSFHFIPHDMTYAGPKKDVIRNVGPLLQNSISDRDMELLLEHVDATHLALVIDACQSGQALNSEDTRQGPMNSAGLAQLAFEKGMFILAASQADEAALESNKIRHGYLTFVLVEEGLKSLAADVDPPRGEISMPEWLQYGVRRVPQLQAELRNGWPNESRALVSYEYKSISRVQTPRVFVPRQPAEPTMIVARP